MSLIGLQNAGKSSFVNMLVNGAFKEDMVPTVGFDMKKFTKVCVSLGSGMAGVCHIDLMRLRAE